MEIGVSQSIFTKKNTTSFVVPSKFIQFNMGYLYGLNSTYFQMWRQFSLFFVLRFSTFVFLILLFCDQQDTGSESCDIKIIIYQKMITHKNIPKDLLDNDIHTIKYGRKILWYFFIFIELELFYYYFVITKTMSWSNKKWK